LHALDAIGRAPLPETDLRKLIGPPMHEAFGALCGDQPQLVADAVRAYRTRYADVGLFENTVYPEIPATLATLAQSHTLYVCTSKPHVFAERIIEYFGLASYFTRIYGAELDGTRAAKPELLAWLLEMEHLDPDDTVMIGDRAYDVEAALACGTACIAVLWGFGTPDELRAAGATEFAPTPSALIGMT